MQKTIENLTEVHVLVVKVGPSLVTNGGNGIDQAALNQWAAQIANLKTRHAGDFCFQWCHCRN